MEGSLGEKIGQGINADVHAWAPGRVVKLFKSGRSRQLCRHEARMTRAAFAAGGLAPAVFDEVMVDGRFGIIMQRFDGPTLQQLLQSGAEAPERAGAILAELYLAVHKTEPPTQVVPLHGWMAAVSRTSEDVLPERIAAGVLTLIDRLPPADGLCHADLHPGNVIMTVDGPKIIDWATAVRAPAIFDIGRAHITLTELVPEDADRELARTINATVQSEYTRLAGMSVAALTAAMQPLLQILRAFVLLQRRPSTAAQREQLVQRIAAALPVANLPF